MYKVNIIVSIIKFLKKKGYYAYKVTILPKQSQVDPLYYRSIKYMIWKFRSDRWYWGIIFLIRMTLRSDPNFEYGFLIRLDLSPDY